MVISSTFFVFPTTANRLLLLLLLCLASCVLGAPDNTFNVMSYGAFGNGKVDDSQAFLKAWKAACKSPAGAPVVLIPKEGTFLLSPLTFRGPCKSSPINMLISGRIVAPLKSGWGMNPKNEWIIFSNVNGLIVSGEGVIDGQGSSWWPSKPCYDDRAHGVYCKGPTGLIFRRCKGLRLNGFSKINGPGSHILVTASDDVILTDLTIIAPGDSPNTDAIDISSSTSVQITNSFIATGDDCIAISAGSSNINISGIRCGPGHGISIGSLGSGGFDVVENVHVRNCTLKNTMTGVRIKTRQGGKGYARNISFEDIKFEAVDNPIQIEQFYCPLKVNCQNYTSAVAISDVWYSSISGTSIAKNVINLSCSQSVGCTNIKLDGIKITSSTPGNEVSAFCHNAHGKAMNTNPAVNCLLP